SKVFERARKVAGGRRSVARTAASTAHSAARTKAAVGTSTSTAVAPTRRTPATTTARPALPLPRLVSTPARLPWSREPAVPPVAPAGAGGRRGDRAGGAADRRGAARPGVHRWAHRGRCRDPPALRPSAADQGALHPQRAALARG